jgi:hypothetical protein
VTYQVDPASVGDEHRAKRVALLNERIALIERTESFDRRWWRVGIWCRYVSLYLSIAGVALCVGIIWEDWPYWPAWCALFVGQAAGWGHRWAAMTTIKRKLAAVHEMAELNDHMRAELLGEELH